MAEAAVNVQGKRTERVELHPQLTGAASVLADLRQRGLFAVLAVELHVVRQGGFDGVDAFIFLLVRFLYGVVSLKDVYQAVCESKARRALGALAGRKRLMSTSPLSSVLDLVTPELVRATCHRLLLVHSGAIEVLRHPWAQMRDTQGEAWHALSFDGTRTALRQRAPEEGEDLDPIRRRALELGKPGYLGQKRGDIVVHRSALEHDAGVWLDARVAPGNGDKAAELASALQAVGLLCTELHHPKNRVVMRMDGEYGNVPDLFACQQAGVPCVSRLSRYTLLEQPDIRERMTHGQWRFVPDCRSGPKRSALDLGIITLHPADGSSRPDGSPYPSVTARVVVTRVPWRTDDSKGKKSDKADHGRLINGWKYELFVSIGLEPAAWPAPELVQLYFGRCTIENRFAQEDRELGLDQIFSYQNGGQELASVAGLFVWNYQVAAGVRLHTRDTDMTAFIARVVEVDPRPVSWEPLPSSESEPKGHPPDGPQTTAAEPRPQEIQTAPPRPQTETERALAKGLSTLGWAKWEARHPGWSFQAEECALRCPSGQRLVPSTIRLGQHANILFRALPNTCSACPVRAACLDSENEEQIKLKSISVPTEDAQALAPLLRAVHSERAAERTKKRAEDRKRANPPVKRSRRRPTRRVMPVILPDDTVHGGPHAASGPFYNLARARKVWRRTTANIYVEITVTTTEEKKRHPLHVATNEERRHARLTRRQKLERYALPPDATVCLTARKGSRLPTLGGPRQGFTFGPPPVPRN